MAKIQILLIVGPVFQKSNQPCLKCDLLSGYNIDARPARKPNESVLISLDFYFIRLLGLDELKQQMVSNIWVKQEWVDHRLSWEPEEYFNITEIRLKPDEVWIPDITLYNSADGKYSFADDLLGFFLFYFISR